MKYQTYLGNRGYDFLQKEKPHLLDFGRKADKWQIIHAWLVREGAVCD